jgi:hypothetical protein
MDEKQALDLARETLHQGNKEAGRKLLVQLLQGNPRNETAWLWLSAIVGDPQKERDCLKQVLVINPDNAVAKRHLAELDQRETASQPEPPPFPPALSQPEPTPEPVQPQLGTRTESAKGAKSKTVLPYLIAGVLALLCVIVLVFAAVSIGKRFRASAGSLLGKSPEGVYNAFKDACEKGDVATAESYVTKEALDENRESGACGLLPIAWYGATIPNPKPKVEVSGNTAYLSWWMDYAKNRMKIQMTMYKSGNTWKIRQTQYLFMY